MIQIPIRIIFRIHHAQYIFQHADIREKFCRYLADIEHKAQIGDSVRINIVFQNQCAAGHIMFFIYIFFRFFFNIFPFQQGNLLQCLFAVRFLLVLLQLFCLPDHLLQLFPAQRFLPFLQFLLQSRVLSGRHSFRRGENEYGFVSVVQQVCPNQILKITAFHFFLQCSKSFIGFHMEERFFIIIQPAVQGLQPKDQSLGITAEIGLPVFEFKIIQSCPQRLSVNALFRLFLQYALDDADKLFFLIFLRSLCHDGKIGLHHAVIISTVYLFPDSLPDQRLFQRSARRRTKGIIQYLKSDV